MATTIRTASQSRKKSTKAKRQDRVKSGPSARAGQTKSIDEVMHSAGLGSGTKKATTMRAPSRASRASRARGGVTVNRSNNSSNSLAH